MVDYHRHIPKEEAKATLCFNKGKQCADIAHYKEALMYYNMALCFSPPGSPTLGKAYASRAAIYLQFKKYQRCIDNITLACEAGHPESLIIELERKCDEAEQKSSTSDERSTTDYFSLSYQPHHRYPALADCLDIQTTEEYGRRVITKRALKPGDIIVVEDIPFKAVHFKNFYFRCANCLKTNSYSLLPFDLCVYAMFCCQDCMEYARDKYVCAAREDQSIIPRITLEALDVLNGDVKKLKLLKRPKVRSVTVFDLDLTNPRSENYKFNQLLALNSLAEDPVQCSFIKSHPLLNRWRSKKQRTIVEGFMVSLARRLCDDPKFKLEALTEAEDGTRPRGSKKRTKNIFEHSVVSLVAPYFIHSCWPNAREIVVENKFAVVVLIPINAGEKISINYGPKFTSLREERRAALLEKFNFECTCVACVENWDAQRFPIVDKRFKAPKTEFFSIKEAVLDFNENSIYIRKNFHNFPCFEIAILSLANMVRLDSVANSANFYLENSHHDLQHNLGLVFKKR